MAEFSNIDKSIMNILVLNSRLSMRQIAKKASVSVATIMHHMHMLEAQKVIKGYTAQFDYEKIGYDVEVMIEVKVSNGMLFEVERKICANPNVFAVYDITGAFDVVVLARFKSRRQMDVFLKKLQTYPHVERTETKLILNTMKEVCMGIE